MNLKFKKTLAVLVTHAFCILPLAQAESSKQQISVFVSGMTCGLCAQSTEKTFRQNKSVKNVTVTLKDQVIVLELNAGANVGPAEDQELNDKKIKDLVEDAGYTLVRVERELKK